MRYIIGTMLGFYILNFWILPFVFPIVFPWGGVADTYLHPIYMGMVLLSGIIVACTKIILEVMKGKQSN